MKPLSPTIDQTDSLNTGLIACYLFHEGTGSVINDISNNAIHATAIGSPIWSTGMDGGSNTALSFNGINQFVDCTNNPLLNPATAMTISVWVYLNSTSSDGWVVSRDDASLGRAYAYGCSPGPNTGHQMQINGAIKFITDLPDVEQWYHWVYSGDNVNGYSAWVNGVLVSSGGWSSPNSATGSTNIGRRSYSGYQGYMAGKIDSVRFWDRMLTSAEVADLYQNPYAGILGDAPVPTQGRPSVGQIWPRGVR